MSRSPLTLDPFYLVVGTAEWIERLVPLGVRLVQLRLKDLPDTTLRDEIRRAKAACERHGSQLVVNDYWRLAIEEGADFIHLGQEDLLDADLSAIRAAGLRLGLSTHDETELERALAARPDYVALGPIWETRLKAMKWAPQSPQRLAVWRARIGTLPLVAIGGIDVSRINAVFTEGADSAAVVTDITLNDDPEARTLEWIRMTERWRR